MSLACGRYDAAFALDDPDAVVDAALSCPACLAAASRIVIGYADDGLAGQGRCDICDATWSLALAPQQVLRLSLDPPPGALVRWSDDLPVAPMPPDPEDLDA